MVDIVLFGKVNMIVRGVVNKTIEGMVDGMVDEMIEGRTSRVFGVIEETINVSATTIEYIVDVCFGMIGNIVDRMGDFGDDVHGSYNDFKDENLIGDGLLKMIEGDAMNNWCS